MRKTIEKLRSKSRDERQRFAFVGAFIVTLLIAIVWGSLLVTSLNTSPQTAQVSSPLESFVSIIRDVF